MLRTGFKRVVLLGAITLIGIIVFQVKWIYNAYNLQDQQFTQTIKIALINVAEKIAEFNNSQLPSRQPIKQVSSNYFIVELNDQISPKLLEHYLVEEFKAKNVLLNFEYSIYDCETDEMIYGKSINMGNTQAKNKQNFSFEKIEQFTYYFGIRFPSKKLAVLKKTKTWVISAFILLGAIVFYTYSLIVIKKQKKISQIQKDFINNMAHEFKTPISTIAISSNYIKQTSKEAKTIEYGNIIGIQNKKLEKQIENILTASLVESHRANLNKELINPLEIIYQVISSLRHKLEEANGIINIIEPSEKLCINADSFHFSNIIFNLVENAIKFSETKPEISIDSSVNGNTLHIKVKDNGIGIPEKHLKKVFRKFYRISDGNKHNIKGFGIGLNYVKNIVKAHKWKLKLDSELNNGTTVKLIIPIYEQHKS